MGAEHGTELDGIAPEDLLLKRRSLRRRLSESPDLVPLRVAVLGGSTTQEVVDLFELRLLADGFRPTFYQSEYGRYYEDAVHDSAALVAFRPDVVYLHTTVQNVQGFPPPGATLQELHSAVEAEYARFAQIWDALDERLNAIVIQNNFELPSYTVLGNLDATLSGGRARFVNLLNERFARAALERPRLVLQDIQTIAARVGIDHWSAPERWFSYKLATTPVGSDALARSLTSLVRAVYGRTRKVLVLDLDNTLWGGVIGDDGPNGIRIGRETPLAEAYTGFQQYCLELRSRGVLLAVCSKNDEAIARQGFSHPDSVLNLEHFASFRANWEPKHENILAIAAELNLSPESFVFVDDNPAEREIVRAQIPGIAVPEIGADVARYPEVLERARYFETLTLSSEDLARAALYQQNTQRAAHAQRFANYGEYLDSLEMSAEIASFRPVYLDRITQLTNKTNQFNLTTRRYTRAEIDAVLRDPAALSLYGRLRDRFGDHGLVSVVLGHRTGDALEIDLWLMSCRVLKRDLELAMLDALVAYARPLGIAELRGRYLPTPKNALVRDHYDTLGFTRTAEDPSGAREYVLPLAGYTPRNTHIRIDASH